MKHTLFMFSFGFLLLFLGGMILDFLQPSRVAKIKVPSGNSVTWDWREDKYVVRQVSDIVINRINVPIEQLVIEKVNPEALTLYIDKSGSPSDIFGNAAENELSGSTLESSGRWVKIDSLSSEDINAFEILKNGKSIRAKSKGSFDDLINHPPVHR